MKHREKQIPAAMPQPSPSLPLPHSAALDSEDAATRLLAPVNPRCAGWNPHPQLR